LAQDRLRKLAQAIDTLVERDDRLARRAREVDEMRRCAAVEIYGICSRFVMSVNENLTQTRLELDPDGFLPEDFRPGVPNLIQINVRGRILQVEFESPVELVSTENFRVPYVLEGAIRSFNQELLDREAVSEKLLYYCLEKHRRAWRFFDARTYHSGMLNQDYLILLMEELL
jgi:hypothetical protein